MYQLIGHGFFLHARQAFNSLDCDFYQIGTAIVLHIFAFKERNEIQANLPFWIQEVQGGGKCLIVGN